MTDGQHKLNSYVATHIPHFHVCNGDRPGGHFLQKEAWIVNDMVQESVTRLISENE